MQNKYINFEDLERDFSEILYRYSATIVPAAGIFDVNFDIEFFDEELNVRLRRIRIKKYLPLYEKRNIILELIYKYASTKNNIFRHNIKRKLRKLGIIIT
jgi:hypothetical protein